MESVLLVSCHISAYTVCIGSISFVLIKYLCVKALGSCLQIARRSLMYPGWLSSSCVFVFGSNFSNFPLPIVLLSLSVTSASFPRAHRSKWLA